MGVEDPVQRRSRLLRAIPTDLTLPRDGVVAWTILLIPLAVVASAYWPGQMNIDVLSEIQEVASGQFTNQHAPLLHALWNPLWQLGIGPGAVLMAQIVAFVVGSYLVLRAVFPRIPAAVVVAVIALAPPLFSDLGSMQRDVWFTALLVLTFGLVVRASQLPWPRRGHLLVLAVAAAWLTLAARQNAVAAVVCACVVIAALVLERRRETRAGAATATGPGRARRVATAIAGGVALTLALIATQIAAVGALGVRDVHPETTLFIYDLAAISQRERENLFPSDVVEQRGIGVVDRRYDVDAMHAFTFNFPGAPIDYPFSDGDARSLRSAWSEAARGHRAAYLDSRWDLWLREIGVTRGIRNPYELPMPDNGGFPFRFQSLNSVALDYMRLFGSEESPGGVVVVNGGPIFSVWVYLLVAAAGSILLLRPSRPWPLLALGALALSAVTHQVGVFFAVMHNAYRFELPSVAVGMLIAAVLLRLAWERRERSRAASQASAAAGGR